MCFSAQSSFIAAGALTMLASITITTTTQPKHKLLALTPLFFGIQQACEGLVWLTAHTTNTMLCAIGMYGFLFFAFIFWPLWIPFMTISIEVVAQRKTLLRVLYLPGLLFALTAFVHLVIYGAVAHTHYHHVIYHIPHNTYLETSGLIIYCLATLAPFFVSSKPRLWLVGLVITGGLIASYIFYYAFLVSIWCFFAALASILISWIALGNHTAPSAR